jgi:nitrile hydratase
VTRGVGDTVRVATREHRGHHRTPGYLKGKRGSIARVHATFSDPETRAYGVSGLPKRRLYLVEFDAREVWGADGEGVILADVFEHWLEEAS